MELILTRIAKKKDYTIGRLSLSPDPSPVGRGVENLNSNTDIKASPTGEVWRGLPTFAIRWSLPGETMRTGDGS